jgi:hypothetical protein
MYLNYLKLVNFIVGGVAVNWYFEGDRNRYYFKQKINPVENLFKYHWGSVVGGSAILGIFYIFDLISDIILP